MRPITLLLCALGGEGGGVLTEWLYSAAVRAGHAAQTTSIPGVAQRTGATTYYVELYPLPDSALGGKRPVFSLNPVPGEIDLLVSSELLETVRQASLGMASAQRTSIIGSTSRALTVAEKMQMTDGRSSDAALIAALLQQCVQADLFDMPALARRADCALSAVMYGAVAASGLLPWPRAVDEATIEASGKGGASSLRGFSQGFDAVRGAREQRQWLEREAQASSEAGAMSQVPAASPLLAPALTAPDLLALARARLLDYQDSAYVELYEQRLARVRAAEDAGAEAALHGAAPQEIDAGAIHTEVIRWLALWMAFDDIVRVAQLKLAASRQQRLRREVAAAEGEIIKVFEYFKPGVAELAGLLPQSLASRLQAWDRRRIQRGLEPWALPLRIGSHTIVGTLALKLVAMGKSQRRRGSRFVIEQRLIDTWLAAIERGAREHWSLGHELALCGRLIKGYGSTNERGKNNLLHIIDHLAFASRPAAERAAAVMSARQAALADDAGTALDLTLLAHGAPARPVPEQTIRWYKRRPNAS